MDVGNLVEYQGQTWRVYRKDEQVRTVTLLAWSGEVLEVENDHPDLKVIADVTRWPFVAAPRKSELSGKLVNLQRTVKGQILDLVPNEDWVPSDPYRAGGSIFLNPKLKMKLGEVLVAHYYSEDTKKASMGRVPITRGFGTLTLRQKRANRGGGRPRTWMDHLLDED